MAAPTPSSARLLRTTIAGSLPKPYGYGIKANTDWQQTLGSEWRQCESTFPLLARSKIDQVSLECASSKVPLSRSVAAGKLAALGAGAALVRSELQGR